MWKCHWKYRMRNFCWPNGKRCKTVLSAGADIIEVGAADIHGPSEENPLFCVARDYGLLAQEALTKENQSMDVAERPPLVYNWFSSSGKRPPFQYFMNIIIRTTTGLISRTSHSFVFCFLSDMQARGWGLKTWILLWTCIMK